MSSSSRQQVSKGPQEDRDVESLARPGLSPQKKKPKYAQGKYWILTIPVHGFTPWLPPGVLYIKGQIELGADNGYKHWQIMVCYNKKVRLLAVKSTFGDTTHAELTRSSASSEYVWKEATAIQGTRFELGKLPFCSNNADHWLQIRDAARAGNIEEIDPRVYICHYNSLRRIAADHMQPVAIVRIVNVFVGRTGTGKSRRAWEEAGLDAYPKDPRTKFWDGYRGQNNVVIDEFRGDIDIAHMLRWTDRYPVIVEVKGTSTVFKATNIWITSNLPPERWYPTLDPETFDALLRRLNVVFFE